MISQHKIYNWEATVYLRCAEHNRKQWEIAVKTTLFSSTTSKESIAIQTAVKYLKDWISSLKKYWQFVCSFYNNNVHATINVIRHMREMKINKSEPVMEEYSLCASDIDCARTQRKAFASYHRVRFMSLPYIQFKDGIEAQFQVYEYKWYICQNVDIGLIQSCVWIHIVFSKSLCSAGQYFDLMTHGRWSNANIWSLYSVYLSGNVLSWLSLIT